MIKSLHRNKLKKVPPFYYDHQGTRETLIWKFQKKPCLFQIQAWCSGSGPPGTILSEPTRDRWVRWGWMLWRWKANNSWRRSWFVCGGIICAAMRWFFCRTLAWVELRLRKKKAQKKSRDNMVEKPGALAIYAQITRWRRWKCKMKK